MPIGPAPPAGMLRQTVLEMKVPPGDPVAAAAAVPSSRLEPPVRLSAAGYLALQRAVGERWLWWERLALSQAALVAIIHDPLVEVRRLWLGAEVVGFSEIDRRDPASVEITFLGLVPAAIGRGLGHLLLAATLRAAWAEPAGSVWLHTCDHERSPSTRAPAFASAALRRWTSPTPGSAGRSPISSTVSLRRTPRSGPYVLLAQRAGAV